MNGANSSPIMIANSRCCIRHATASRSAPGVQTIRNTSIPVALHFGALAVSSLINFQAALRSSTPTEGTVSLTSGSRNAMARDYTAAERRDSYPEIDGIRTKTARDLYVVGWRNQEH